MSGRRTHRRTSYRGRVHRTAELDRKASPEPALAQPYAATLQGETSLADLGLLNRARLRHDRIRWWWGERKLPGWHGAYCYLCDRTITEWDTRYPITKGAQADILDHRDGHLADPGPNLGTSTPAMLADGDATPAGGQ